MLITLEGLTHNNRANYEGYTLRLLLAARRLLETHNDMELLCHGAQSILDSTWVMVSYVCVKKKKKCTVCY